MIRLIPLLALLASPMAFAASVNLGAGQSYSIDMQNLRQAGGRIDVTCQMGGGRDDRGRDDRGRDDHDDRGRDDRGRDDRDGRGRDHGRDDRGRGFNRCDRINFTYIINSNSTDQYLCLADGRAVGQFKSCHSNGSCGSEVAIKAQCRASCERGELGI